MACSRVNFLHSLHSNVWMEISTWKLLGTYSWYFSTNLRPYWHYGTSVFERLLLVSDMMRISFRCYRHLIHFTRSVTILFVSLGVKWKFKKQQCHTVSLQLATGIYPEPFESSWLTVTGDYGIAGLMYSQRRWWRFNSSGFKPCRIVNSCRRFETAWCLHLMLYPEHGGIMLIRNAHNVWQQSWCHILVRWNDTRNFRRDREATSLTEAHSSHSIHNVAGALKLLEHSVRNVGLWY
jgi:hypothetical protein